MRSVRKALLAGTIASAAIILTAAAREPSGVARVRRQQTAVAEWRSAHKANLPRTLEEMSELPKPYRHAALVASPIATQRALWHAHIATFLAAKETLTPAARRAVEQVGALNDEQRQFLRQVLDMLPAIFDESRTLATRQAVAKPLCDKAKRLFTARQAALLMGNIGPEDERIQPANEAGMLALYEAAMDRITMTMWPFLVRAGFREPLETCTCNQGSMCDCFRAGGCNTYMCSVGGSDCGCFDIWPCNGTCDYYPG